MGLGVIMIANLFLVQVNSSDRDSLFSSMVRFAKDKVMWVANILTVAGLFVILYSPLNGLLKLAPLSATQFLAVLALGTASVLWMEGVKLWKRARRKG
jgi:Ca2+-transporting ATPase